MATGVGITLVMEVKQGVIIWKMDLLKRLGSGYGNSGKRPASFANLQSIFSLLISCLVLPFFAHVAQATRRKCSLNTYSMPPPTEKTSKTLVDTEDVQGKTPPPLTQPPDQATVV